jgi:hypothetical protein
MRNPVFAAALLVLLIAIIPDNSRADDSDYDTAMDKAQEASDFCDEVMRVDIEALHKFVTAISQGNDEERRNIMQEAGDSAIAVLNKGFTESKERTEKALELLDAVIKDPDFQDSDKKDKVRVALRELTNKWAKVQKVGEGPGKINPLREWLIRKGEELHEARKSGCPVGGLGFDRSELDCGRPPCDLIEFKPDNARAKDEGTESLRRVYRAVCDKSDTRWRERLNDADARFAQCKNFTLTIEAYTLTPEIDDEGNISQPSESWSTYTVSPWSDLQCGDPSAVVE